MYKGMGNIGLEIKRIIDCDEKSNSSKVAAILSQLEFAVEILKSVGVIENMGSIAIKARSIWEKTGEEL